MKKNLGYFERAVRVLLGVLGLATLAQQPEIGTSEVVVLVLGVFLILNGLSARCYLWKLLGLNSAGTSCGPDTPTRE